MKVVQLRIPGIYSGLNSPLEGPNASGLLGQPQPFLASLNGLLPPFLISDVFYHGKNQGNGKIAQRRNAQPTPNQRAIPSKVTFFELVVIYKTCSQLLKKNPILFCVFRRRKVNAVFVSQLLTAETQE